jgi:hypothetical protein
MLSVTRSRRRATPRRGGDADHRNRQRVPLRHRDQSAGKQHQRVIIVCREIAGQQSAESSSPARPNGTETSGGGGRAPAARDRLAGLCGGRLRQGRPDPAGAADRRLPWRAATRSRPARRCFTQDDPTTARRATRRRRCWRRPRNSWPTSRPAASRPKSSRPRPISRMPGDAGPHHRRPGRGEALLPRAPSRSRASINCGPTTVGQAKVEACRRRWRRRAPMGRDREIDGRKAAAAARAPRSTWPMAARATPRRRAGRRARRRRARAARRDHGGRRAGGVAAAARNIFVRFFVPEAGAATCISAIAVALRLRRLPGRTCPATISFISPQAEYTPPVIYSESSRPSWSSDRGAAAAGSGGRLNPGQPVEVRPIAARAP